MTYRIILHPLNDIIMQKRILQYIRHESQPFGLRQRQDYRSEVPVDGVAVAEFLHTMPYVLDPVLARFVAAGVGEGLGFVSS